MARLNFKDNARVAQEFQTWIIEDSWDGCIFLEARVIKTWQGLCSSNKILEGRNGYFYWWAVFFTPEGERPLQRLVTFLDWDSVAEEFGMIESAEKVVSFEVDFH